MEFVHCNFCGHLPQVQGAEQRKYFITSCGHLTCGHCMTNEGLDASGGMGNCVVCKVNCKLVELRQDVSPDIKCYFTDAMGPLQEAFKKYGKVVSFQRAQAKNYQGLMTKMYNMCRKLNMDNADLKKQLLGAQTEIGELKRRIESLQQEQQTLIGTGGAPPAFTTPAFPMSMEQRSADSPTFQSFFAHRNTSNRTPEPFFRTPSSRASSGTPSMRGTPFSLQTQTPASSRLSSSVYHSATPMPNANRFSTNNVRQTPDIHARLRSLRCSAVTPPTKNPQ